MADQMCAVKYTKSTYTIGWVILNSELHAPYQDIIAGLGSQIGVSHQKVNKMVVCTSCLVLCVAAACLNSVSLVW